jgi:DNA-binding NarL/FixJ family response regulator
MKPPDGLTASVFEIGGERLVVLGYPITHDASGLTRAEQDVVDGALAGKSNRRIAVERGRSARTVANQMASAFRKLGVASRSELAAVTSRSSARDPRIDR